MKPLATFDVEAAKRMKEEGKTYKQIAQTMGVSHTTIERHINLRQRQRRLERDRERRAMERGILRHAVVNVERVSTAEILQRMATIPRDTRTRAQIIMGDPIPERSALWQRMRNVQQQDY